MRIDPISLLVNRLWTFGLSKASSTRCTSNTSTEPIVQGVRDWTNCGAVLDFNGFNPFSRLLITLRCVMPRRCGSLAGLVPTSFPQCRFNRAGTMAAAGGSKMAANGFVHFLTGFLLFVFPLEIASSCFTNRVILRMGLSFFASPFDINKPNFVRTSRSSPITVSIRKTARSELYIPALFA